MKPAARFNMIVTTATIFLMWAAFTKLLPWVNNWWAPLATILSSVAVFRGFAAILAWMLEHSIFLKARVFGPYFMHGTWVGHFIGRAGDRRYVVEHFEQTLHALIIRGRSYAEDGSTHANWTSEAAAVDAERGRLIYTYSCDVIQRGVVLQGVGVYHLERLDQTAPPTGIDGYVADLLDGIRIPSCERKINCGLLAFDSGLVHARQIAKKSHALRTANEPENCSA